MQFQPRSPYAVGKAAAFWAVANYREAYGLFACSGILFNHESPLRSVRYVTQKIVRGAMDVADGSASVVELGNLDLSRDWGWAPEYVDAMRRMLDMEDPTDLVIATGQTFRLQDFVARCFAAFGLDWAKHIRLNEAFLRPTDVLTSYGNPEKARKLINWEAKLRMPEVVDELIAAERIRRLG